MQKINNLSKETKTDVKEDKDVQRQTKATETVNQLSRRFAKTCAVAKQQYSHLSSRLQAASGAKISPCTIPLPTASFSPTPTLTHRVTSTLSPSPSHPPRPHSAHSHPHTLTEKDHYHPVPPPQTITYTPATTFSLEEREREEDIMLGRTREEGRRGEGRREEGEREWRKSRTEQEGDRKEGGSRRGGGGGGKEVQVGERGGGKEDGRNKEIEGVGDHDSRGTTPEIISLEGSPVIPGRRILKLPSQDSPDSSPEMGRKDGGRDSPVLLPFREQSPDLWIAQPKSSTLPAQKANRVQVLPVEDRPKHKPPPPPVKPKPAVSKKPQTLKQKGSKEDGEGGKGKPKRSPRFPRLPGFGVDSPKLFGREPKGKKETEREKDGRESPKVGGKRSKTHKKERREGTESPKLGDREGEGEWEGEDGRGSPILQGRGVKVMILEELEGGKEGEGGGRGGGGGGGGGGRGLKPVSLSRVADKQKPPPVPTKPAGLKAMVMAGRKEKKRRKEGENEKGEEEEGKGRGKEEGGEEESGEDRGQSYTVSEAAVDGQAKGTQNIDQSGETRVIKTFQATFPTSCTNWYLIDGELHSETHTFSLCHSCAASVH